MNKLVSFLFFLCVFSTCKSINDNLQTDNLNIILIISDDQAWTDYGFMGHPHIQTPTIDKLSRQGITYTRGFVTSPLCSPSLASIITGLYPHQHGITGNDPDFSSEFQRYGQQWRIERQTYFTTLIDRFTNNHLLTRMLADFGYLSFQSGKWWLGSYKDGGFDYGMTHGVPEKGGRHGDFGLEIGRQGMDTIYRFVELAIEKKKPFFLWYAPFLPHAPHNPPDSLLDKYTKTTPSDPMARYRANCEWFDVTVGQLINYLEGKSLIDNSIILFLCDNGWLQDPDRRNRYLEGSKRAPYDMGIRTPIMISWPGHTVPVLDSVTLVSSIDIAPTILQALGIPQPESMQGISLLDRDKLLDRNRIFSEVFFHDIKSIQDPTLSLKYRIMIKKGWKLMLPSSRNLPDSTAELYEIIKDPFEKNNLVSKYSDRAAQMKKEIDEWWKPGFE